MKKIKLTQGKFALVDNEDYKKLSQYKWYVVYRRNTFYAVRAKYINGKRTEELMHRRIMGLKYKDGKFTDHINRNGLDNRKNNIRICTIAQNGWNRTGKQSNNTSGYKGVCRHPLSNKWRAQIKVNSQTKHIGFFTLRIDAAQAYNDAAIKYFGEFANLNQI